MRGKEKRALDSFPVFRKLAIVGFNQKVFSRCGTIIAPSLPRKYSYAYARYAWIESASGSPIIYPPSRNNDARFLSSSA